MGDCDETHGGHSEALDPFLTMFAPHTWSPVRRFRLFLTSPFPDSRGLLQATLAAENRRQKLYALVDLANQLRTGLVEDQRELERAGYTPTRRSRQFSAVAETLFLELYSSLDAIRATLFEAYPRVRGMQTKSTERLFRRAHEKTFGPEFPEPVRQALSSAFCSWYPELRRIRGEVSHGDIGSCHIDAASGHVVYLHGGLGTGQRALVIEDLEAKVNELAAHVMELVSNVFSYLCSQLEPIEVRVPCGIFRGRIYERTVAHSENLDFHSGVCFSRRWFENEPTHLCPMRTHCGAYSR